MAPGLRVTAAAFTHTGCVRPINEDCIGVGGWHVQADMESPRLFEQPLARGFVALIADGMGGHAAGDIASRYVTRHLAKLLPETATPDEIAFALRRVNVGLCAEMCREPRWAGMGAAVAGLLTRPDGVTVFNVGDVRVYRAGSYGFVQLSVDDAPDSEWQPGSLVPRSGILTQCLGGAIGFSDIAPHVCREDCSAGSTYLLCSDGLYEALTVEEMAALIGPDLPRSAQALFDAAMAAASTDNVSIILVRLEAVYRRSARTRKSAKRPTQAPKGRALSRAGHRSLVTVHRRRRK